MNDEDIEKALRPLRDLPRVPPERRAAAFDRVHAQWRAELDSRQAAAAASRRRAYAVAASVLLLVFGGMAVWFSATRNPAPQLVATIAAVHGGGDFRVDASIRSGERLETRGSTLSLSLLSGLVVRVAPESVLVFDDAGLLELERGRVFVDSQPARMPDPLIVRTVLGDVRHLGTQYLASFERGELEVAVREGVVALQGTQAAEPRATAAAGDAARPASAAAPSPPAVRPRNSRLLIASCTRSMSFRFIAGSRWSCIRPAARPPRPAVTPASRIRRGSGSRWP